MPASLSEKGNRKGGEPSPFLLPTAPRALAAYHRALEDRRVWESKDRLSSARR